MIQKVLSFVQQHHMIERDDCVLAGVSGGADSVCLLLVLEHLKKQLGYKLCVVHVEHGIRGEASLQDAEFVQKLCEQLEIECKVFQVDAVAFARQQGMSLEEGARELRYDCFSQAAKEYGANKIAVAHNQNDCAETLLFHLARGTGLKGMCGILPVRDRIIRPLLCVNREEIEHYLEDVSQPFCNDATNQETEYSRNKIRHQVLPVLKEINAGAVAHLYRSTEYVTEAVELIESLVQQARGRYVADDGQSQGNRLLAEINPMRSFLLHQDVEKEPLLIRKMLVLELMAECAGKRKDIGDIHVLQALELLEGQVGRRVSLPYNMEAERTYEGLRLAYSTQPMGRDGQEQEHDESWPLVPGEMLALPEKGIKLTTRILNRSVEIGEIPKKAYTKWFDYDKIKDTVLVRHRCQGDFFILDEQGRKQSLKKYFINEKVPAKERNQIWLLAEGSHVIWAIGYRISEAYKVSEKTKRILEIQVNGGNRNE